MEQTIIEGSWWDVDQLASNIAGYFQHGDEGRVELEFSIGIPSLLADWLRDSLTTKLQEDGVTLTRPVQIGDNWLAVDFRQSSPGLLLVWAAIAWAIRLAAGLFIGLLGIELVTRAKITKKVGGSLADFFTELTREPVALIALAVGSAVLLGLVVRK